MLYYVRKKNASTINISQKNKPHHFHVKSTWEPPIQQSVSLTKCEALNTLKCNTTINLKKVDKGTTPVQL